jgi:uncharacterized protein YndB with AHSA1/START domain
MVAEPISASVVIDAEPAEVYEYFTRAEAMVLWMGQFSSLDPVPGGKFAVDVNGVEVRGRYLELEPPNRLLFTWGFVGSDVLPPETSTVEVLLRPQDGGTCVEIIHSDLPRAEASKHAPGWRHFLEQLAKTVLVGHGQNAEGQ